MNTKTYIARVPLNVHHKLVPIGGEVELTDEEAAGALAVNAITSPELEAESAAAAKAAADAANAAAAEIVAASAPVPSTKKAKA